MIETLIYKEPLYVHESLEFISKRVNGMSYDKTPRHSICSIAEKLGTSLETLSQKVKISDPSLYRYFKNTHTSVAYCLLYSFNDILAMEDDNFVDKLSSDIEHFRNDKIDTLSLDNCLKIQKEPKSNDALDELLKLPLDDEDKIRLLKAIIKPKAYVEQIFADIDMVKRELAIIYRQLEMDDYLKFFNKDNVRMLLDKVNVQYDDKISIIPSVVEYASMNIFLEDVDRAGTLMIRTGAAIDVDFIRDHNFFVEDMPEKIEQFVKIIGDKSKLKIIELLKDQEMYGAQLAEALKLKTPTISYHVDALMNAGIVSARRYNNRVYFSYDKKRTLEIIDNLRKMFE